ncbi:MAG: macro domain-containing protein [Bulleidia sp.]
MPLKMIRNDITKVEADAIVNTANPKPKYASGTDRAVYLAAGVNELLKERMKIGEIAPGHAAVTPAFALHARYIIHTVGPAWHGGDHGEYEILRSCYAVSLAKAKQLGCTSIAFPLIATGVYGFPKDQALQIALDTISGFLMAEEMTVYLVVYDDESFQLSTRISQDVQSYINANHVVIQRQIEYPDMCVAGPLRGMSYNGSLEEVDYEEGMTFQEKLFELIDQKGLSNTQVYKAANMDRKHFSKIQCNRNYHPGKKTAMALCIALKLDMDEAKDLLSRADWAFSPSRKMDLVVMAAIERKMYDINQINAVLFDMKLEILD